MRWQDLPERYGKYKSVHKRFSRWSAGGVWDGVFADLVKDRRNQYLMPNAGLNHCAGAPASGHGQEKRTSDAALGRSRGGLTTRIHLLADEHGLPVSFLLTSGLVHDCTQRCRC
jgi:transposase